jgi:hypothetical protein
LKSSDVEKMKKEGYEKRFEFEEDRNLLEDKFHVNNYFLFIFLYFKRKFFKKILKFLKKKKKKE